MKALDVKTKVQHELSERLRRRRERKAIAASGLFDAGFYARHYPDVAWTGRSPLNHYVEVGAGEGRLPNPLFDPAYYLESQPDVRAAGGNPLAHYVMHGAREGRNPHPLFDSRYYLATYPDVAASGVDPLLHFLRWGGAEGRNPSRRFDSVYYLRTNPDVAKARMNPLVHYVLSGAREGREPMSGVDPEVASTRLLAPNGAGATLKLLPLRGLTPRGGDAFSARDGAAVSVEGHIPSGWSLLEVAVVLSGHRGLRLHYEESPGQPAAVDLPPPVDGVSQALAHFAHPVTRAELELPAGELRIVAARATPQSAASAMVRLATPVLKKRLAEPWSLGLTAGKFVSALQEGGPRLVLQKLWRKSQQSTPPNVYAEWVERFDKLDLPTLRARAARALATPGAPTFSIVMPVYETPRELLERAIASVQAQVYTRWELCIADDASKAPHVREVLERAAREDPRIKVVFRETNGHISAASNSAIELASGDFIALLDHDDELREHALLLLAENLDEGVDLIYSDEDKLDSGARRFEPHFKPDFNLDYFLSNNYLAHFTAIRASLVRRIGGFRLGLEGSQDYDLYLRALASCGRERIRHVPRVLYHWRAIEGSTALSAKAKDYAERAGRKALQDHLDLLYPGAVAEAGPHPTTYRVRWPLPEPLPLVSLIIPTRDHVALVRECIETFYRFNRYAPVEILLVDNQSRDPEALAYFESLQASGRARVLRYDHPFNYSAINNFAAREAKGQILGLVNNDLEFLDGEWLPEMVACAARKEVGAVGARLLYPDRTVQHAGVILGLGGVAGHPHKFFSADAPGYFGRAHLPQELSAVTAACLLVRREIYEQVGGLDESLAVAFNDVDFCLRVREAGYRNVFVPWATMIHHESKSRGVENTRAKQARFLGEVERMHARWGKALLADPAYNPNLTIEADNFTLAFPPRVDP